MTLKAVVQDGQLVLKDRLQLPNGTELTLNVDIPEKEDALSWLAAHAVETGLTDGAEQHDHYIYGALKHAE
jgi:hypothetical protein